MRITKVAALFVDARGIYPELLGRGHCWAGEPDKHPWRHQSDDARLYKGDYPVVAHPPCQLWVNLAAVNWVRYKRQKPAWYPGGTDGGCFAAALAAVRRFGGVLEHPASSHAWRAHHLVAPLAPESCRAVEGLAHWQHHIFYDRHTGTGQDYWVCEVWQSAYGGRMRKRTWLVYCGQRPPFELLWARNPGTHQCGWFDRNKPTVSKREASATPVAFAKTLIALADWSRGDT
jgi:hypothetical protein